MTLFFATFLKKIHHKVESRKRPKTPMERWQEDAIEGTLGVRAVAVVEELKDALVALFVVSSALDSKLIKW